VFAVVLICSTGNGNSCIFWNNICNGGENDNDDVNDREDGPTLAVNGNDLVQSEFFH